MFKSKENKRFEIKKKKKEKLFTNQSESSVINTSDQWKRKSFDRCVVIA